MIDFSLQRHALLALAAAALFGASTPFAKLLLGEVSPVVLAGLLYLGSGIGLALLRPSWGGRPLLGDGREGGRYVDYPLAIAPGSCASPAWPEVRAGIA